LPPSAPTPELKDDTNPVLLVLLLAGVAFALSQTLVLPALPELGREMDASASATSWILTGFLLSASVSTPLIGKLGDLYGKGRVLTLTMLTFSAGSVLCALAPSIEVLIAGRVVQGVAGGVFPLAFGIIRDTFPRERVPGAIGLLSAMFGIGAGIGLPLAGVIVDNLDVSWLFWIGCVIAFPAALASRLLVPPSPPVPDTRLDLAGAVLLSTALAALLLGVTEANDWGWSAPVTLGLLIGGVVVLGAWLKVEASVPQPLIELRVLRGRAVAATNLTGLLVGFAMFSSFLLVPQFAQAPESTGYGFGFSITEAGLVLTPAAVAQLLAGPLAGRLGVIIGFRATLAGGAGLASAAFLWLAFEHGHPWNFVVSSALLGAGISFAMASMANLIVAAVPQQEVGIATGINTVTRTVGGAFGAGVATAVLTSSVVAGSSSPTEGAFVAAFVISAVGGAVAVVAALLVPRDADRAPAPAAEPVAAPSG
jgi:EmrB/QacA subfamily drug resistance transporter